MICACVPLVAGGLFLLGRFPDTPAWHLSQGDEDKAIDSLRFYRGGVEDFPESNLKEELQAIMADVNRVSFASSEPKPTLKSHSKNKILDFDFSVLSVVTAVCLEIGDGTCVSRRRRARAGVSRRPWRHSPPGRPRWG